MFEQWIADARRWLDEYQAMSSPTARLEEAARLIRIELEALEGQVADERRRAEGLTTGELALLQSIAVDNALQGFVGDRRQRGRLGSLVAKGLVFVSDGRAIFTPAGEARMQELFPERSAE